MKHEFEQIAQRLKGLRESLDMTLEEFAASCNLSVQDYELYESGDKDLTMSLLKQIGQIHNIDISVLMYDNEPRMNSYFVTRKGKGQKIDRKKAYQYQILSAGFNNRKADIFEVTVEPKNDNDINLSSHEGQEFDLILEGKMLLNINGKDIILEEGDSIYFDSSLPHGMKALDEKQVRFLAVVM